MKNSFALKVSLAASIALVIFANSAFTQSRNRTSQSVKCLTDKEAENLIRGLKPISEPNLYVLKDSLRYSQHTLSDVQRNYPIAYLFYRRGYFQMEDNGAHTFQFITTRGQELSAQYPQGIPFNTQTLISVNRVRCVGKKAYVTVTVLAKPTQTAIALLGAKLLNIKPFGKPRTAKVGLIYRNGEWQVGDAEYYNDPDIHWSYNLQPYIH